MAGNFRRGRARPQKLIGRGELQSVETEGPFNDWVGMPPYYLHALTVDGEVFSYLSGDKTLEIEPGKTVTFRYRETKEKRIIDKNSLGVVIDPSELG
ncbi:hypothetical protein [Motiliproteus sp. SC1-56]|uniref:hypothetical protein n=1 Tax=Motiliproteus sp. SC1-56 TaxID=2799565 RepID=UPI001A8F7F69|nr:hypothetical protein [Motiliproteus sp. SC1-56]